MRGGFCHLPNILILQPSQQRRHRTLVATLIPSLTFRHKPSSGGKYSIAPAWVKAPSLTTTVGEDITSGGKVGVRYGDFLRTCLAASDAVCAS